MPVIKLKTKKLNHLHIFYPPWNSRSLKAEKLNERYITQQSSFLKLASYPWTCIWIFSNYSGNSVIMTRIINLWKLVTECHLNITNNFFTEFCPKSAFSDLRQFLANESPLKMMKNAVYFTSKAPFVLKVFKFFRWLFRHVEKRLD